MTAAFTVEFERCPLSSSVPGSQSDEAVESMIKPEAAVDLVFAILLALTSAQIRTKK
jgi:hypothetical protein